MVKDGMVREPERDQPERPATRLSDLFQRKTVQRKAAQVEPARPDDEGKLVKK